MPTDDPALPRPMVRCLTKPEAAQYLGIGITLFDGLRIPVSALAAAASTTAFTSMPGWTTISSEGGPESSLDGP